MDAQPKSEAEDNLMLDEALEAPPIVRFDERRMHIRAYNYWASLLGDRNLPSIEDLNPAEIEDFGSHSVLLDFTGGMDDPAIAFLGSALASQCDLDAPIDRVSQIPARTLLSRLTDHYLQIIANAAPIGFEAEFVNQRGHEILYRGIMMPFSSDDDSIDFVYGVINWKEVAADDLSELIAAEVVASEQRTRPASLTVVSSRPVWDETTPMDEMDHSFANAFDIGLPAGDEADELELSLEQVIETPGAESTLEECLTLAREAAAAATASESRTRHALYRAIGLAHGFALAAQARPEDYAALLAESGIAVQPRSPMTALAKLVFGADYDKTRLAEFVCAIDHALSHDLQPGALIEHLHTLPGGLKALVREQRAARRGDAPKPADRPASRARKTLGRATPLDVDALATDEGGLAIVVVRRESDGSLVPVATLGHDDRLVERVITAAAKAR